MNLWNRFGRICHFQLKYSGAKPVRALWVISKILKYIQCLIGSQCSIDRTGANMVIDIGSSKNSSCCILKQLEFLY